MLTKFLRASIGNSKSLPLVGGFSQANSASGGTTTSISRPTGLATNNLMVAWCFSYQNSNTTFTAPSGWTLGATGVSRNTFYKIATSSEPTSYTFTSSTTGARAVVIVYFTGGTNDVIGTISADNVNPAICPSITVGANNSLVVATASSLNPSITYTTPSGYSVVVAFTLANRPSYTIFAKTTGTNVGATGDLSITATGTSRGQLISVKPN